MEESLVMVFDSLKCQARPGLIGLIIGLIFTNNRLPVIAERTQPNGNIEVVERNESALSDPAPPSL
jgi:hypothetical protein